MLNLIRLLQDRIQRDIVDYLGFQIEEEDFKTVEFAVNCVVYTLVWKIAKTANEPEKSTKLAAALDRDHHGEMLDDPIGYWAEDEEPPNQRMLDGNGIVYHNFGKSRKATTLTLCDWTGLKKSQVNTLLE